MPTAAEVRQRVEQADTARIQRRAEAAAAVVEQHAARDDAAARLAEAERHLAEAITSAEQHMTRKELAEFVGAKANDVEQWATAGTSRSRRRSSSRNRSRTRTTTTDHSDGATTGTDTVHDTHESRTQSPATNPPAPAHTPSTANDNEPAAVSN